MKTHEGFVLGSRAIDTDTAATSIKRRNIRVGVILSASSSSARECSERDVMRDYVHDHGHSPDAESSVYGVRSIGSDVNVIAVVF